MRKLDRLRLFPLFLLALLIIALGLASMLTAHFHYHPQIFFEGFAPKK